MFPKFWIRDYFCEAKMRFFFFGCHFETIFQSQYFYIHGVKMSLEFRWESGFHKGCSTEGRSTLCS